MKIAIVGSRDYPHPQHVTDYVNTLPLDTIIVSGGARGVDTWAEQAARRRGMTVIVFKADWKTFGKVAGFMRNREIIDAADSVTAFWDLYSPGTKHSISTAREKGKPVVINPDVKP
jgi:hypothetical protein